MDIILELLVLGSCVSRGGMSVNNNARVRQNATRCMACKVAVS